MYIECCSIYMCTMHGPQIMECLKTMSSSFRRVGVSRRVNGPQTMSPHPKHQVPVKCDFLRKKKDSADIIIKNLKIRSSWIIQVAPNLMSSVPIRDTRRRATEEEEKAVLRLESETAVMQPKAKQLLEPPERAEARTCLH